MKEKVRSDADSVYHDVRSSVISAQQRVYSAVNAGMDLEYHQIGEKTFAATVDRAEYVASLIAYIAKLLTAEFENGFDATNLLKMRLFYILFPIRDAVRPYSSGGKDDKTRTTHKKVFVLTRTWGRYEREFSLDTVVHMDWHVSKYQGKMVCVVLDDASTGLSLPERSLMLQPCKIQL